MSHELENEVNSATDTKQKSKHKKQPQPQRQKPMVVTDDDLRDIGSYKKYKIKAKPVRN